MMVSPALDRWIRGNATYAQVMEQSAHGMVGNVRYTQKDLKHFMFLWTWSTDRFGGLSGEKQDLTYSWGGRAVLDRRILRVQAIIRAILYD